MNWLRRLIACLRSANGHPAEGQDVSKVVACDEIAEIHEELAGKVSELKSTADQEARVLDRVTTVRHHQANKTEEVHEVITSVVRRLSA